MAMTELPDELANSVLDSLYELRGERFWWKDEPRCGYQVKSQTAPCSA